jgi:DNA repair exonuclease SbcCD ATPase subunit
MSMQPQTRSDEQNRALLARLRPEHENLKRAQIRAETEAERAASEQERIEAEVLAKYGTIDVDELQARIEAGWQRNSDAVDAYQTNLDRVRQAAARIDAEDRAIETILKQPNVRIADLGRLLDERIGAVAAVVDEVAGAA